MYIVIQTCTCIICTLCTRHFICPFELINNIKLKTSLYLGTPNILTGKLVPYNNLCMYTRVYVVILHVNMLISCVDHNSRLPHTIYKLLHAYKLAQRTKGCSPKCPCIYTPGDLSSSLHLSQNVDCIFCVLFILVQDFYGNHMRLPHQMWCLQVRGVMFQVMKRRRVIHKESHHVLNCKRSIIYAISMPMLL